MHAHDDDDLDNDGRRTTTTTRPARLPLVASQARRRDPEAGPLATAGAEAGAEVGTRIPTDTLPLLLVCLSLSSRSRAYPFRCIPFSSHLSSLPHTSFPSCLSSPLSSSNLHALGSISLDETPRRFSKHSNPYEQPPRAKLGNKTCFVSRWTLSGPMRRL